MTPHKALKLQNVKSISELDISVPEARPVPQVLECYLHDTSDIKSTDILHWQQVPDFDMYKVYLKDGRTFEISGPAIYFYQTTAVD